MNVVTACYTIEHLVIVVSLFVLIALAVSCFLYLCVKLITGAILEVKDIENRKKNMP